MNHKSYEGKQWNAIGEKSRLGIKENILEG